MSEFPRSGLVVTAHPGDFVWRAGGAIALHAGLGYRMKVVCLSFGERGEAQGSWAQPGMTLEACKAGRRAEAEAAAAILGAEIEFFDAGDYPLRPTAAMLDRLVDIFRELRPAFVLTHPLADPYNVDHPEASRFAQEARIIAQAAGHKPGAGAAYGAPQVFQFEPHQPEQCGFRPDRILDISGVWDTKWRAFAQLPAQRHLWDYYQRVALNRGMQGGRNSVRAMTHGEAYQSIFPEVVGVLA